MAWIVLLIGGLFEVGFTTAMRYVDGFRNLPWTLTFGACIALSFYCLSTATKTIPVGTAYAVWAGFGAVGTAAVGILFYGEAANPARIMLVLGIVACIVGLKVVSGH